jgi:hypothetical protein
MSGSGFEVALEVSGLRSSFKGDVELHLPGSMSGGAAVFTGVVLFQASVKEATPRYETRTAS